jgi:hypothetical protein
LVHENQKKVDNFLMEAVSVDLTPDSDIHIFGFGRLFEKINFGGKNTAFSQSTSTATSERTELQRIKKCQPTTILINWEKNKTLIQKSRFREFFPANLEKARNF